jgi:hypothetical protein
VKFATGMKFAPRDDFGPPGLNFVPIGGIFTPSFTPRGKHSRIQDGNWFTRCFASFLRTTILTPDPNAPKKRRYH